MIKKNAVTLLTGNDIILEQNYIKNNIFPQQRIDSSITIYSEEQAKLLIPPPVDDWENSNKIIHQVKGSMIVPVSDYYGCDKEENNDLNYFISSLNEYECTCLTITNNISDYISFCKYKIQEILNNFLKDISLDIFDYNSYYYRDLKESYKFMNNDLKFSESQINQFEKIAKSNYESGNMLYVKNFKKLKELDKN